MQIVVEEVRKTIEHLVRSEVGRNVGEGQPELNLQSFVAPIWAETAAKAEHLQEADELSDFLLYLRPEAEFDDPELRAQFSREMNEIAKLVKPICEEKLSGIEIPGFENEAVGFQPPYAVQTLEFVIISLAQELFAQKKYGLIDPLPCQDLLKVYQHGHILCGYDTADSAIILY
ncbi:hypothetical protein JJJ17_17340 [Paracoccus caeni]|uniref:Uncharacterized protein n=1 Tax=Paracoccus caeni TaxID=657651 RepID=A0A934SMB7_9RHOB|nr:hypothetical protein [Paracoccus caeni]MBK4217699.1 hypothetical protein [Paracoccus caeni]